jgi:CcmD family protein
MMNKLKYSLLLLLAFISFTPVRADSVVVESLHESGKMGAVIAVIGIIFTGLIIYLVRLDRKLTRLEKEINKNQ